MYFISIKNTIGEYFLVEIEKQIYCFRLAGSVKTFRATLAKTFRALMYDIEHYRPIDAANIKQLEDLLNKNSLPKINNRMFGVLKHFANKEKTEGFKEHSIKELIDQIEQHSSQYGDQVIELSNYLQSIEVDKIVTPTKKIVEFLDSDFKATDPKFFGTVMTTHLILEKDHKKITNYPVSAKKPWLKIILIVALIGLLIGIIYVFASGGAFNNIIPSFPIPGQPQGQSYNEADLMKQYPSPEAMKEAINHGQLDYSKLPPDVKKMVDTIKTPIAIPSNQH